MQTIQAQFSGGLSEEFYGESKSPVSLEDVLSGGAFLLQMTLYFFSKILLGSSKHILTVQMVIHRSADSICKRGWLGNRHTEHPLVTMQKVRKWETLSRYSKVLQICKGTIVKGSPLF